MDEEERMGKVVERVKLTNVFDSTKSVEVDAVVDTGATMVVMPQEIVDRLGLRKLREATVKYANNKTVTKEVYCAVLLEIQGRVSTFDVLAEVQGSQPLIGQVVLEILDLVVESRKRGLSPDPLSPEAPMVEIMASAQT